MLLILAVICFGVAAVWNAVLRAWPSVFLCAGLAFLALVVSGPITLG